MLYGRDYDESPKCAEGHTCEAVDFCVRCDGIDHWCEKHLKTCEMCKRTFCPRHAEEISKTDMGLVCEECREEFCDQARQAIAELKRRHGANLETFGSPLSTETESDMERARR